jgi:hypothetical protein
MDMLCEKKMAAGRPDGLIKVSSASPVLCSHQPDHSYRIKLETYWLINLRAVILQMSTQVCRNKSGFDTFRNYCVSFELIHHGGRVIATGLVS